MATCDFIKHVYSEAKQAQKSKSSKIFVQCIYMHFKFQKENEKVITGENGTIKS